MCHKLKPLSRSTRCIDPHSPSPAHNIVPVMENIMSLNTTLTDVKTLRAQARANIDEGAVTAGYAADRLAVLKMLNEALATEVVCMLRYRRHHFMARGIHAKNPADEVLVHANQELAHADRLAARIVQLGDDLPIVIRRC